MWFTRNRHEAVVADFTMKKLMQKMNCSLLFSLEKVKLGQAGYIPKYSGPRASDVAKHVT